jgi:hypothetical protein
MPNLKLAMERRRASGEKLGKKVGRGFVMQDVDARYVRSANLAFEVLFQGKWRVHILCAMRSGPVRLGQLARLIPGAPKKILTQNLRNLRVPIS